jgi:hypothetical protein
LWGILFFKDWGEQGEISLLGSGSRYLVG